MVNIFVDPAVSNSSPVIRIGEICFSLVGDSQTAIDTTQIDSKFNDCPSCEVCDGVDCGGDPSMIVSVFDADYVGADINWCGKTWTQSEVQAGETRCVCPTTYNNSNFSSPTFTYLAAFQWAVGVLGTQLDLFHTYKFYGNTGFCSYHYAAQILVVNGQTDWIKNYGACNPTVFPTNIVTYKSSLNVIIGITTVPTRSNYQPGPQWFGNVVQSGVTYSWAKGNDWV